MKKVLNWTIGSFFRTIGRTIAFIVMGGLIYYILTYNGIGIEDLFFDKVNASEIYTSSHWLTYYTDDTYNTTISGDNTDYQTITQNSSTSSQYSATISDFYIQRFTFNQNGYITIPFNITYLNVSNITHNTIYGQDYCQRYQCTQWDSNNECLRYTCDYVSTGQNSDVQDREYIKPNIIVSASIFTDNQYENHQCEIENNLIKCSINANTNPNFYKIRLTSYVYYSSNSYQYYLNLGRVMTFYSDSTTNAIQNQTQQQQQQHEEMMDSNTTEAEEEATSFFEDFDVPDVGGLSAIITAPLNTIRSLLNSSCTNLTLPLPYVNENIVLPCMNSIYTEHFGAFFSIYQTIILAIIAYRCIRSIYFDIHGFTNPDDDRIEVMDL